ncbi:MAG: tetratricopeptide (TPR) repeat protein [Crocinitomicaceae bacterium]|jgi:tetratricopeptide (TPR) repeat protein
MVKPIILGTVGVGIAFLVKYVYETSSDEDIFFRLAVTVLAGLYAGLLFLIFVLPAISDGIARLMFSDPGGAAENDDAMREARSLQAQGDYVGAVESLRQVVTEDSQNRLAWADMAKIQMVQLEDAEGALAMLVEALSGCEWEVDDAAFFMFRISEVQLENMDNRDAAVQILQQVCATFPESRHSANATHQLRELGAL